MIDRQSLTGSCVGVARPLRPIQDGLRRAVRILVAGSIVMAVDDSDGVNLGSFGWPNFYQEHDTKTWESEIAAYRDFANTAGRVSPKVD